jgi:hypothetical protein
MSDVHAIAVEPAAAKPPQRPLEAKRLKLEQHAQSWFVTLGDDTPREGIFRPAFWLHVASKMHPLDRLSVTGDAGTFYLECLVVGIDRQRAYIQQVSETSLVTPRNLMMRTCTSRGLGPTEDGKSSAAASRLGAVTRHGRQPKSPWQASRGAMFNPCHQKVHAQRIQTARWLRCG